MSKSHCKTQPLPNPATQPQGSEGINRLPAADRHAFLKAKQILINEKTTMKEKKSVCLIIPRNSQIHFGLMQI